ncbi:ribosome maturation factor RimP [Adhaeribacter terreus]|uniref:Ribosome maturation factor RimP n=1 Tax=Adhaeribacter terreus TaxID=529703 RepID=A0ABW0E7U9_9BACT
MSLTAAAVEKMLEGILPESDLFLVGVTVSDSPIKPKVTVMADGDQGISIDQCASISRRLAKRIEEQQGEEFSYVLEVTSPGIDYPLTTPRQYQRNVGRKLKLKMADGAEKVGVLNEVTENGILLTEESKGKNKKMAAEATSIPFADIVKANIVISFK